MQQFKTKLGTNKGLPKSRIWIEGKRLAGAGFIRGAEYSRQWDRGKLILILKGHDDPRNAERASFVVSGKSDKPIIDITGKAIVEAFGAGESVNVTFQPGYITIEGVE